MANKVTLPTSPDELREFLEDEEKVKEAFGTPEEAHRFITQYAEENKKQDPGVGDQVREGMKEGFDEFMKAEGFHQGRLPMSADKEDDGAPGRVLSGKFPSYREFLKTVAALSWPQKYGNLLDKAVDETVRKDLSEGLGADGGFLVPEEFRAEILRVPLEQAVVRPRARVIPMASSSIKFPSVNDTTHASSVFGGVSGTWVSEAGSVSSSTNQPAFAQVLLTARKLTGYTVASRELLQDSSVSLEAMLRDMFGEALAYFEDDAFINGTGAGQPLGLLNADALVTVSKETGQAASTIAWENIVNMYSRMLPSSINRAVWLVHPDTFPQLATMSLTVGTGGSAVWLMNGQNGPPMTILGRPVIVSEKAQTVGTAGDIYFLDPSLYLIGDRQSLSVDVSEHYNFATDEITWLFVQRVEGRPWIQSAITPRNGSNTLSPFVNLAARS